MHIILIPTPVVEVSLEDTSISIEESDGTYMVCVVKDRDTITPVQVDIQDIGSGSALRVIGESIDITTGPPQL